MVHFIIDVSAPFLSQPKEFLHQSGYTKTLEEGKKLRIDNQYYLKNRDVKIFYTEILDYVLTIQDIKEKISTKQIKQIRRKIRAA